MQFNSAAAALAGLMSMFAAVSLGAQKPVALDGRVQPDEARAGRFVVTVQFDIAAGWHIYDEAGEGPEVRTSLRMKLPDGVKAVDDWRRPVGSDGMEVGSKVYEGRIAFTKSVVVEPRARGKKIEVTAAFQACTDEFCNPPQNKTIQVVIPHGDRSPEGVFEAPVRLMVKGAPLNSVAKKRFPSPAIFDVDGDGQAELVIGSLMGSVGVYENLNEGGAGDPVWGERQPLKGVTGVPIRTSNW